LDDLAAMSLPCLCRWSGFAARFGSVTGEVVPRGRSGDGGAVLGSAETRVPATVGGALSENAMEWVDIATDQTGFPDGDHGVPSVHSRGPAVQGGGPHSGASHFAMGGPHGGGPHGTAAPRSAVSPWEAGARGAPLHVGRQRQIRGSVPSLGARVLEVRIHLPPAESRLRTRFLQRRVRGLLFAARQDRLLTDHRERCENGWHRNR